MEFTATGKSSGVPGLSPGGRPTSNSPPKATTWSESSSLSNPTGTPSASSSSTENECRVFAWSHGTWMRRPMPKEAGSGPVCDQPPPTIVSFPSETTA